MTTASTTHEAADQLGAGQDRGGRNRPGHGRHDEQSPQGAGQRQRRVQGSNWNVLATELLDFPPDRKARPSRAAKPNQGAGAMGTTRSMRNQAQLQTRRPLGSTRPDRAAEPTRARKPAPTRISTVSQDVLVRHPASASRMLRDATPTVEAGRSSATVGLRVVGSRQLRTNTNGAQAAALRGVALMPERRTSRDIAVHTALSRATRGVLASCAMACLIALLWIGAGALSSIHNGPMQVLAGSSRVAGGYRYVARPGDSLWSIATRLDPGGDPRPIVAALSREISGRELMAGDQLVLP